MKKQILDKKINQMVDGLTFDDILLLPNYTDFKRENVNLTTILHPKIILKIPILSSPMDTVTEEKMAIEMAKNGGLGIIHRNLSINKQVEIVKRIKKEKIIDKKTASLDNKKRLLVGAAVGVGDDFKERVDQLIKAEVDLLVIDSGHGFSSFIIDGLKYIKKNYPQNPVMVGNIATSEAAKALVKEGADILRVGMGPGSICTTRIVTGVGVPQLTAIANVISAINNKKTTIVADGGIKQFGDIAKALAFGADAVMLGSLLAGCEESPGKKITINGKVYKHYRGMGSVGAMKKGGAERYGQKKETDEKKLIAEGVEGMVKYKGKLSDYIYQIVGSLKSSFYYVGAKNIKDFFEKSRFVKISQASLIESHPHSLKIIDPGKNYHL
ncbi:MAG: IMP dehydrogenase [Patescibacteria group bacterium]|nr:IMP dehydrogenase [Patescibacteria group bacterium]